jgi:hypothetical protein
VDELPFVDEHVRSVDASPDAAWAALLRVVGGATTGGRWLPRLLGCDPSEATADFGTARGQAVPGFRIDELEPGKLLSLRGRHRFADYRLTFLLGGDRIVARTHARFPGLRGRLYRALVIGSGGHRRVTRRLLDRVARAARREQTG